MTTKGIVTSCSGTTAYIQDANAAICVYGSELTIGDEVKVKGTLTTYNGLLEITSPTVTVLSQNNTVTPEVMTIAEINTSSNQGWLVKIEDATVTAISGLNTTIAQGDNTIVVRGISDDISVNDVITLTGNIGCYYNAAQIANPTDVAVKVATPTFDPESGEVMDGSTVTISTTTDGATIYYTTNGDEPATESTLYTEPITINADMTIKAIAVKDGMTNSNVASATYTLIVIPTIAISTNLIEAPAAGADDNVGLSYTNLTIDDESDFTVQYYDGEGEETDAPSWLNVEVVTEDGENYSVSYAIENNTSTEARTAYFKVYAMDDEVNLVYSDLVTVTQAAFVPDYAELPFEYDGNATGVLPYGLTQVGLGTKTYSSSPKIGFDTSDDELVLKINEAATELSFDIKGNSFSGGTFTVQTSDDGETYTDLMPYTEITNSTQSEKFLLDENVRYIKWVYTEKDKGNVALGNIKVQKRLGNATVTLAEACHNSENIYYGTYSNANAFVVPDDLTVAEVGIYNEFGKNKLTDETYKTGDIVPANTGVVVSSATAGAHRVELSTGGTTLASVVNCLRPTGSNGITAEAMEMDEANENCVFYRLTMHKGTDLGFYWGAAEGAAFAVAANKAYLAVPKTAGARIQGFSLDGDTITGISQIENGKSEVENYFDLQGRSIANPAKGLYIKNGKKVVIR